MSGAVILLLADGDSSAFPSIASITQTTFASNSATSHAVAMPAACVPGDLKIVLLCTDGSATVTVPNGWSEFFSTAQSTSTRLGVYARVHVAGDPATVDFVTSAGEQAAAQVLRVVNWNGSIPGGMEVAAPQTGTGVTADPDAFSPTFGAGNILWIVVLGDSAITPVTAAPTGYTDLLATASAQTSTGAQVYSARKTSTSATEDPGTWTSASGGARVFSTIAIAPAP